MKYKTIRICLLAVFAAGLMTSAQEKSPEYRTNIPFDFHAGNKILPAGSYIVAMVDFIESRNVLTIQATEKKESQTLMFDPKATKEPVKVSELIFNRYEKQYFLAEIISPTINGDFSRTPAETRLAETHKAVRETVELTR